MGQFLGRPKVSETLQRSEHRNDSVTRQQKVLTGVKLIVLRRPQAYLQYSSIKAIVFQPRITQVFVPFSILLLTYY